jgi:hypothetical protein
MPLLLLLLPLVLLEVPAVWADVVTSLLQAALMCCCQGPEHKQDIINKQQATKVSTIVL